MKWLTSWILGVSPGRPGESGSAASSHNHWWCSADPAMGRSHGLIGGWSCNLSLVFISQLKESNWCAGGSGGGWQWAGLHPSPHWRPLPGCIAGEGKWWSWSNISSSCLGFFLPNLSSCSEREQLERERALTRPADGAAEQQMMLV